MSETDKLIQQALREEEAEKKRVKEQKQVEGETSDRSSTHVCGMSIAQALRTVSMLLHRRPRCRDLVFHCTLACLQPGSARPVRRARLWSRSRRRRGAL